MKKKYLLPSKKLIKWLCQANLMFLKSLRLMCLKIPDRLRKYSQLHKLMGKQLDHPVKRKTCRFWLRTKSINNPRMETKYFLIWIKFLHRSPMTLCTTQTLLYREGTTRNQLLKFPLNLNLTLQIGKTKSLWTRQFSLRSPNNLKKELNRSNSRA